MTRITLVFEHPPCIGVRVDVRLPLPDPVQEGAETTANRISPACPLCKQAMQYVGFYFSSHGSDNDAPEPNHPFPGPGAP